MPLANLNEHILFYDDTENSGNPQRKIVDWKRISSSLEFDQVFSERFLLPVGITKTLEASVGAVDLSATSVSLDTTTSKPTWYRIQGSFPSSPWASSLAVAAQAVVVTVQANGSVVLSGSGLAALTNVKPGDWVYLAGSGYGDTGPFSLTNQGFWVVESVNTGLVLRRIDPLDSAVTETVTIAAVNNIQHLPDSTRPRWCFIRGSGTFAGLRAVTGAAIGWVAVTADSQFVPITSVTFDKLIVAPKYLAYVRVETDKPVTLLIGDTASNEISLQPISDIGSVWYESFSFSTSLAVKNSGGNTSATINLIYAFV